MKTMRMSLISAALSVCSAALAQTAPIAAMPEATAPEVDCPALMQQAEMQLEEALQVASAKRWKDAQPMLAQANGAFLSVASQCPPLAVQAEKQSKRASSALKNVDAALNHQGECQPRLDKALELDIQAATARGDKAEPALIERLLGEAENVWREAAEACQSPHKEKAEKSLAATMRARASNAELLSAGPACDAAWKSANSLGDLARSAWKEKRWDDAAALYSKGVLAWEGAAEKCPGARHQQALRKVEQAQTDAHNAEFCGPQWDVATELSQQLRGAGASVSATDKDVMSFKAEVAWRDAAQQCRGNSQNLARGNGDAIARERGTPLPPQAQAQYGNRKAPPPVVVTNQPVVEPVTASAATPATALAQALSAKPVVAPLAAAPVAAAVPTPADSKPVVKAEPSEVVWVAGDATYRGLFTMDASGAVSGNGRVEWSNGERYTGALVEGRKHGKGRFEWVGGQWYEGDWVDDQARGRGVIRFVGGNRYEGAVKDGEPSGRGTQTFPSGDYYSGDFTRGVFHGKGSFVWKNGNRYEGDWKMGKKHGHGRLTWANGEAWEGEFQDDRQTDNGKSVVAAAK